jgi:PAS domain S-box-containing protein
MNVIEKMLTDDFPAIIADSEGLITEVNVRFLETYNWEESALIGEPLTIIIPGKFHDAHNLSFSRFLHTGISSIFSQWVSLEIVDGKGDVQIAKHFIVACETPQGTFLAAHIVPED